ncbi:MAG: SDR family oxidoreductase [Anaerolineaceae bacterium]|nr:SDR family oxidoreductase [Anaerolineaceae bacterium]
MIKGPVIITGASRGMGREIAMRIGPECGAVSLWATKENLLKEVAVDLNGKGVRTHISVVNVSDENMVAKAAAEVEKEFGSVRAVVNCAGIANPGPFDDITVGDWDTMFAVNTRGVFLVTHFTLPLLRKAGGGSILNIVSEVGRLNQANNVIYGASKFAVVGFTQGLALELAPEGIRVNALAPGPVETDMWDMAVRKRAAPEGKTPEQFRAEVIKKIPLGRFPTAREVAEAAAFLLDDDRAGAILGDCLFVTGGSTVY